MAESNLHLNATIGCVFAGTLFATLFYGCTCGQGLYYISEYPDDQKMVKALVLILWGLDTTTTVTDSMLMWDYVVRGHQTPATLATMPAIGSLHHLFSGTTIYIVQMYYVFAIWKLMYSKWWRGVLAGFLSILSLTTYGLAIVIVYLSLHNPTIDGVYTMTRLESIVQPTISCVTDVCITISLSLLLRSRRIRATVMYTRTDTLLRKLMVYAINRGIFTALVQSLQVILYASSSTSVFWWALFYFPGCKVYVNSTFAMLNARHHICRSGKSYFSTGLEMHEHPVDITPALSPSEEGSIPPGYVEQPKMASENKIDCKVTTEILQQVD